MKTTKTPKLHASSPYRSDWTACGRVLETGVAMVTSPEATCLSCRKTYGEVIPESCSVEAYLALLKSNAACDARHAAERAAVAFERMGESLAAGLRPGCEVCGAQPASKCAGGILCAGCVDVEEEAAAERAAQAEHRAERERERLASIEQGTRESAERLSLNGKPNTGVDVCKSAIDAGERLARVAIDAGLPLDAEDAWDHEERSGEWRLEIGAYTHDVVKACFLAGYAAAWREVECAGCKGTGEAPSGDPTRHCVRCQGFGVIAEAAPTSCGPRCTGGGAHGNHGMLCPAPLLCYECGRSGTNAHGDLFYDAPIGGWRCFNGCAYQQARATADAAPTADDALLAAAPAGCMPCPTCLDVDNELEALECADCEGTGVIADAQVAADAEDDMPLAADAAAALPRARCGECAEEVTDGGHGHRADCPDRERPLLAEMELKPDALTLGVVELKAELRAAIKARAVAEADVVAAERVLKLRKLALTNCAADVEALIGQVFALQRRIAASNKGVLCANDAADKRVARCYSDHDEDIRTKGSCDYCRDVAPQGAGAPA